MIFVKEMNEKQLADAVYGVDHKVDSNGKPIEQGRGTPGSKHADSLHHHNEHLKKESWRNFVISRQQELMREAAMKGLAADQAVFENLPEKF